MAERVLVCQNKACRKSGAAQVLWAFQADPVAGVEIIASGCLGQCGNGPMVRIEPEGIWYHRVSPAEVPALIDRQLHSGRLIPAMLYPKFHLHPENTPIEGS